MNLLFILLITKVFAQNKKNPPYNVINPAIADDEGILGKFLKFTKLDKAIESNLPVLLRDFHKLWVVKEPVRAETSKSVKGASIMQVRDNYVNSILSGCSPEEFKDNKCVCKETYPEIYGIESQSLYTQGAVAANKKMKKLIISYRGTKNLQNGLMDLSYSLIDSPNLPNGAQVAEGFYSYHLSIFHGLGKLLAPMLENPEYEDYTVQITGFSLGAAAAMASVPDWIQFLKERNDHHKVEFYGYSGPRSGNAGFAKYINELGIPITRYTNYRDYVPQLPPRSVNFVHAGVEVYQTSLEPVTNTSDNMMVCSTYYDEDPKCNWAHHDKVDLTLHVKAFGRPFPVPTFC